MLKEDLQKLSTEELLNRLKKERQNIGWTSSKATYMATIHDIIKERGEEDKL